MLKNSLTKEERFLIKVLFEETLESDDLKNIDFDQIVILFSNYLLLPALYLKIKKNNARKLVPVKFYNFLKNIHDINFNRNKCFIDEINSINKIFKKNNIQILFIKSASIFIKNLYTNAGERMIGDIDFLIKEGEKDKAINLLNSMGYKSKFKYRIWKTKHCPRMIAKNKLFAIEPHLELLILRKRKELTSLEYWKESKKNQVHYLALLCILNSQINDYCHLYAKIDFRCINDIHILQKFTQNNILKNFKNPNIYLKRFLMITNLLGISNNIIEYNLIDKLYLKRLIIKRQNKIFRKIDNTICAFIKYIPIYFMQSIEFLINKNYRKNVISKLRLF